MRGFFCFLYKTHIGADLIQATDMSSVATVIVDFIRALFGVSLPLDIGCRLLEYLTPISPGNCLFSPCEMSDSSCICVREPSYCPMRDGGHDEEF